jgi:ArsR family transcriptional regulator
MLGDETRLRMMMLIKKRPICVCELEQLLTMKQARISKQLMNLREHDLVQTNRQGLRVFYELSDELKNNKALLTYLEELESECGQLKIDQENLLRFDNEVDTTNFVCKTLNG